jgi:predicted secreted protein
MEAFLSVLFNKIDFSLALHLRKNILQYFFQPGIGCLSTVEPDIGYIKGAAVIMRA